MEPAEPVCRRGGGGYTAARARGEPAELVLAEAVLTYIDIGVDPSMESWGNMINGARLELAREPMVWWSLSAAFVFMFALVLAANIFADAVRDAFDPRLRDLR